MLKYLNMATTSRAGGWTKLALHKHAKHCFQSSVYFRFRPSRRETADQGEKQPWRETADQELSNEEVRTFQNNAKKLGVGMHRVWKAASVRSRPVPKQVHPKHPTAATVGRRRHGKSQNTRKTGGPLTTRRLSEHVALLLSEKAGQHEHTHSYEPRGH